MVIGQFSLLKSTRKVDSSEANKFLILLAIGHDGDILEVWTILLRYLSKNPPLLGKSLIGIPFTLTSSNFRLNTGLKTGVDLLNEYYDFKTYQYRKYGFNLNAAQEMVLNFSCPGVLFGFVSGLVSGLLTKWYYKRLITKDFFQTNGLFLFYWNFLSISMDGFSIGFCRSNLLTIQN